MDRVQVAFFLVVLCLANYEGRVGKITEQCTTSATGQEYAGRVAETKSGIRCQRWDRQSPHKHSEMLVNFPDNSWEEAANYCRNPDKHFIGPWCLTVDPTPSWESCSIPHCECKTDRQGKNYMGHINRTKDNIPCQRWDSHALHRLDTGYDAKQFPDHSLQEASNYCRNPDDSPRGPWCFSTDPSVRWQYCDVPFCDCKINTEGKSYEGIISRTSSGKACQRWDSQKPHAHKWLDPKNFPDKNLHQAANMCRNPDGKAKGPWCFTTDPNARWEYCTIPSCFFEKKQKTNKVVTGGRTMDCKESSLGREYAGKVNQTSLATGSIPCQRWDSQTPHKHKNMYLGHFPDASLADAANFCRNPDKEFGGPWCYTKDPKVRWKHCDIPWCGFHLLNSLWTP